MQLKFLSSCDSTPTQGPAAHLLIPTVATGGVRGGGVASLPLAYTSQVYAIAACVAITLVECEGLSGPQFTPPSSTQVPCASEVSGGIRGSEYVRGAAVPRHTLSEPSL